MNRYLVAIKGTRFHRELVAANPDDALFRASQRFAVTKADLEIRRVTIVDPQRNERDGLPAQAPAAIH